MSTLHLSGITSVLCVVAVYTKLSLVDVASSSSVSVRCGNFAIFPLKWWKPDISIKFLCFVDRAHLSIVLDNDQLDAHLLYFTIRLL